MGHNKGKQTDLVADVGQLLTMGFEGTEMSSQLSSMISRLQPGGIILFARNIVSARQTYELLKACQQQVRQPLFRCVDMEGGVVDRLKKAIAPTPSAAGVFATGDAKLYHKHGRLIGEECRIAGFNVDFAPVSDLAFETSRSVMGSRAVSADSEKVISYVREFLRGLNSAGVLGCGKHFPGLGEGNLDSHHQLPVIEKPWDRLWEEDMVPYRRLRREFPMVLVSHAAYPTVTEDKTPASLSVKWITEVLRKTIGYRGIVVSDDLEMGGVLAAAPIEQASIATIRAGADIFLICRKEEYVIRSFEAVLVEAERDRRFAARVRESAKRIGLFKRSHRIGLRQVAPTSKAVDRLARRLWEFSEEIRLQTIAQEPA